MTISQQVVRYAQSHLNKRIGRGECFDLADRALRAANASSAADYGPITANADYVWGLRVMLGSAQPGDIIQFRNYRVDINNAQGVGFETRGNPNHTAIVASVGANGVIEVFEQNVYNVRTVKRNTLYFQNGNGIRVSGQFIIYRPQPRG
jgi:hypothetical protein